MLRRRRQPKSSQRFAAECFGAGVMMSMGAIALNAATYTACSTVDFVQRCTQYTYEDINGLAIPIFTIVLVVVAIIFFASGIYHLMVPRATPVRTQKVTKNIRQIQDRRSRLGK